MSFTSRLAIGTFAIFSLASQLAVAKTQTGDSGVEKELRFQEGDESGNEIKALKTELLVTSSEKKALAQLLRLEQKYAGSRMEPEILFRLAELYMRRARSERFFEVHRGDRQIMSFAPEEVKGASESNEIRKAIAYYDRITGQFPHFRMMDVVEFNTGYAYQQLGQDQAAEAHFRRLITDHGSSNLVPDSYLAVGEINFKAHRYQVALENFKAISKFPQSRVYPYGLYKAAWCYYDLQDATSGMTQLEEVIRFGARVAANNWDSKLDLRKEALADLALFYSDVKSPDGAVDYFIQHSEGIDSSIYLMKLVAIYKRHGKLTEVETVLKQILVKMPESDAVPSVHEELVWNYDRTKRPTAAVAQLVEFDNYCSTHQPPVAKKLKKGEQPPRSECITKISETSKKLATKWHATWKKFGEPTSAGDLAMSSEKAYRLYFKTADAHDVEKPTVRYAFAELMFSRGQFREASEIYAGVEGDKKAGLPVDPKVLQDSHYAAALSLEKAVGDKWSDEDEQKFAALADRYLAQHPQGTFVLELQFKRAYIAYEKGRYDEAAPIFKKIGWAHYPASEPLNEKVAKAQDLYLDILNIKKDFKGIKEAAKELLAIYAGGNRTEQIGKIYREAYFSEIQQLEEQGDAESAIEAYKKFALENSKSELAPKAWWNASQLQFRIGDATGGANTCYQMHKLFPNSTKGKDCLTKAATTFEAMARLDLAAKVLLNLAEVDVDQQNHWREVAADFFALSGAKDRAISMYMKLASTAKGDVQLALYEKSAALAKTSGDQATLLTIEGYYSSQNIEPQASRLFVEQAEQAFEKGDMTRAFNTAKRIISRDTLPKELLARARFVQARVLEDEYRKQSVKARVSSVGFVLAIKTEKLEKAQKAFQSAIHYADPNISVKALSRLGDCYLDFASTVRNMTFIATLSTDDQKSFRAEIEQMAVPMEEKGVESINQALETAKKFQLRNGEIAELQIAVNKLNMKNSPMTGIIKVAGPQIYLPAFELTKRTSQRDPASLTEKEIKQ